VFVAKKASPLALWKPDARMEELIKDIIYSEKYQDDTYEYR